MKRSIFATALTVICTAPHNILPAYSQTAPGQEPALAEQSPASDASPDGWWSSQPKEQKLLYTNVAAAGLIGIWGLIEWDYGSGGWNTAHEGWFEKGSKYGGADKCGHFWSTYTFSDALTALYKDWGYASEKANTYAALSAWTVQALMEMGDATSTSQGFSYEDMIANTVGALASVLMERYPELDRRIDFRVEYVFDEPVNGIFDDYSNQFYSVAFKLDGFHATEDSFLKYFELHAGYFTRGYGEPDEKDSRSFYGGITLNFSRLFEQNGWTKTGKTMEYLQIPYSVLKASHDLD